MPRDYLPVDLVRRVREAARHRCGYCLSPQQIVIFNLSNLYFYLNFHTVPITTSDILGATSPGDAYPTPAHSSRGGITQRATSPPGRDQGQPPRALAATAVRAWTTAMARDGT